MKTIKVTLKVFTKDQECAHMVTKFDLLGIFFEILITELPGLLEECVEQIVFYEAKNLEQFNIKQGFINYVKRFDKEKHKFKLAYEY